MSSVNRLPSITETQEGTCVYMLFIIPKLLNKGFGCGIILPLSHPVCFPRAPNGGGRMTEKKIKKSNHQDSMRALQVFRGYTVDARLRQFRKVSPEGIEFLDFSSPEGDELLGEYIETLDKDSDEFRDVAARVLTR